MKSDKIHPLVAIEVDFTHKTSDQKIRLIQDLCQKDFSKDFVPIIRLQVEMRFLAERLQNPDKPYKMSADLVAVNTTRDLNEPLLEDEYLFKQRLICAGDSHGDGNGNGRDGNEEADFLRIPLDFIDTNSISRSTSLSISCEELRSALAEAVEKQNEADRMGRRQV